MSVEQMNIEQILSHGECEYIEYKQRWYWDLPKKQEENTQKCIGEFIKDFLALVNANENAFFSKIRYLIIGYDECSQDVHDFGLNETNFKDIQEIMKRNIKKFISNSSQLKYNIEREKYNGTNIIVVSIFAPSQVHSLSKSIDTKTISYQSGTSLYRSDHGNPHNKSDNVGVMPPEIIHRLSEKIRKNGKDKINIKNKSIESTINSFLERNINQEISKKEVSNDSKNFFEFYEIINQIDDKKSYFLYISEDGIKSTVEKFYGEYGRITQEKIIILIDRPIKLKNPENRKSFVKQLIDEHKINATIYFIDEFGKMFLYKKDIERFLFDEPLPNTQRFIEHQVKEKGEVETNPTLASKLISEWFQSENQPVIVLLGEGGIGKTTLAKYFINHKFRNNKESNYVLFLDSSSIIDRLNNYNINAIYDLYRASESDNSFTEELFKLAIDNGSLTIVLDGLDEIISRLNDKFQLDNFLYNICNKYCFNSAKTKIIITCRDSIWYESTNRLEKQLNNLSIREITLNPFDDNQAKDFFEKCFKDDVKKQKKSMNLVQKMNESSSQKLYNPFALETIYSIVSDNTDTESLFSSDKDEMKNLCFNVTNTTDYLIYAICKREYKKIGFELGIQISVLCELSKRRVSRTDFVQVLQKVTNNQTIREEQINLFLAHPFIHENKTIGLRYDFLKEFFSCLLISTNLSNNKMDSYCFDIIGNKVGYLNDFSKEVSKRVFISQDDITIYCMSIFENDNIEPNCKSSIFLLYLSILQERGMLKNQEDINNAVTDIFCEDKFMKNLCISNVGDDKKTPKLIIDFSDKIIENFHISNYHYFSNCIFNNNTLFKNGTIYLTHHKNSKINFSKENFDLNSVKLDDVMKTTLNNIDKNLESRIKSSEKILHEFIRKFYDNGRFKPQKQIYIKSNQGQHVDKMLEAGVIIEHKNSKLNEKEFVVNPDYKDDFINLLNNGVPNKKIIQLIDRLNQ